MSAIPLVINKTMKYGDWMFDRDLERVDAMSIIQRQRRKVIEKSITFQDLLEETVEFTEPQQELFMGALASDDAATLLALLDQAKQNIVKRLLAQGY
jgi:hypothetical protein